MLIGIDSLPSGGFGSNNLGPIVVKSPTYNEVLDYVSGPTYKPNSIGQLKWDLEYLVMNSVQDYKNMSAYDLDFIISIRKLNALLDKNKFYIGDTQYSVNDISFTNITDEIKKLCKVGDYKFRMPTVGEVEAKLASVDVEYYDKPKELIVLSTGMGIKIEDLLNMPVDMIATIEYLKPLVMSQPKVKGGTEDIILLGKSSDLFQYILKSKGSNSIKIEFTKDEEN